MTTIQKQFSKISSYQSDDFKEQFGDMEYVKKESPIFTKTLGRNMSDKEILSELRPTELELGEVFSILQEADKGGYYISYCRNKDNVLWAVYAYWLGDSWYLSAYSVENPHDWHADYQVCSRDSFETPTLNALVSLSSSAPLTLAIKKAEIYDIGDNEVRIENGRAWLKTKHGQHNFIFQGSTPETLEKVGKLLLQASELAKTIK